MLCLEHKIEFDGQQSGELDADSHFQKFFMQEEKSQNFIPRNFFIDLDPETKNWIKYNSALKNIYHPECFLNGVESSGGIYSCAFDNDGSVLNELLNVKIQKYLEVCENCQGFLIINNLGGGTGSGLSAKVS